MEISDLQKFLVIARHNNLQKAALELDVTPGALSKSLKRLESSLATQLFDRVGKNLRLNLQGERLQPKAAEMVTLAEGTLAEFSGQAGQSVCRIAAPAILQYRWISVISRCSMAQPARPALELETVFEQQALHKLVQGEVDLALVTGAMLASLPSTISTLSLGELQMQVAAGRSHKLVSDNPSETTVVDLKALLAHPFAAPHISPFCGEQRGVGCDGWQEQHFPRQIGWVVNDYAVLGQLVKSGQALAYLPDFLLREWQLTRLIVQDCPYTCTEQVFLAYRQRCTDQIKQLVADLQ